jgi:hypothetical protein
MHAPKDHFFVVLIIHIVVFSRTHHIMTINLLKLVFVITYMKDFP